MSDLGSGTLPEYAGNPFIAALPPILSQREMLSALSAPPHFDLRERDLPATLRKHCVLRLGRTFHPMARQVQLAERIGMLIRQGYIGRNPATTDYLAHLQDGAERIALGSLSAGTSVRARSTASSLALAGCSGAGKSETIERTLALYPQIIRHESPFSLTQVVWLKLDCPTQGSPKQLCINFFTEIDRLVGTDYLKRYGHLNNPVEWMLLHMAQVARLHAVGLLVVDELQNLRRTAIGPDALMNFLVLMINTIGIPVAAVGTLGALPILQRNFRQARRSTGIGSAVWDRMPRGAEWDAFITHLWKYQWTRTETAITQEIRECLYDESQGVVDVVVKLFIFVQLRIIAIGEVRSNVREELKEKLIQQVAREHLVVVRPMLDALRKNDKKAIEKYDDLAPLQAYLDEMVESALGPGAAASSGLSPATNPEPSAPSDDVAACVANALVASGFARDVAEALLLEVAGNTPAEDPLGLMGLVVDRLRTKPPKEWKKSAKQHRPAEGSKELAANDLRRIVEEARMAKQSAYDALVDAGVVGVRFVAQAA